MNTRGIKISFSLAIALYLLCVCFNNLVDYSSNFSFVSNVAAMSDTFTASQQWRAIKTPLLRHLLYVVIIAWEGIIAICCLIGAFRMIRNFGKSSSFFKAAKQTTTTGLALGVLLWFTVFITIGGEWFLMWQSKSWNAQPNGFFLTGLFLLFLLFHNTEDNQNQ